MFIHGFIPPQEGAPRPPAVLVLQEAFGVNPHIRRLCRRLAGTGVAVFSPELFHRTGPGLEFGYEDFPRIRPILGELTNARVGEDLAAAFRHVAARPDVDPTKIAVWGFCLGGWAAVLAACELPLAACVSFYGGGIVRVRPGFGITPLLDRLASAACPLLLVYGAKDAGIPPEDVEAVRARLSNLGKRFEIEVYPEAGHGFFCEDRAAYHAGSAEASWVQATRWLREQLQGTGA